MLLTEKVNRQEDTRRRARNGLVAMSKGLACAIYLKFK